MECKYFDFDKRVCKISGEEILIEENAKRVVAKPQRVFRRKDVFLQLFPDAKVDMFNTPTMPPCYIDKNIPIDRHIVCSQESCNECITKYWNEVVG